MPFAAAWLCAMCATAALGAADGGAEPAGTYTDATYGYRIAWPQFAQPSGGNTVMFFAPAKDGFAANVGVMVQQPSTRDAFRKLTEDQLKSAKLTLLAARDASVDGVDALRLDYQGQMQGRDLRWCALAVFAANRTYVVTCTAPQADYADDEKRFDAVLASFSVPTAAAPEPPKANP